MQKEKVTQTKHSNFGKPKPKPKYKDPRFNWRTIFLKNSGGFSSKRILAIMGFLVCISIFIAAFIMEKEVPEFGEVLLICCVSLYGVDVIPNWSKNVNVNKNFELQ